MDRIEALRRERKWSAARIALELTSEGHQVSARTVGRWFDRLGINRRRHLDTGGESNRRPRRIIARYPGHMVHLDVKKVGRIPDGGGWRAHGRGSDQHKAAQRAKTRDAKTRDAKTRGTRAGYVYLHSAVDGFSRLAYTEHLTDEKAATTIAFFARARAFFAAHGINRIVRVVTDNGANYRASVFGRTVGAFASRHQRTRPYTPRHNGKVERYQRILAEEFLYARTWTSETERANALGIWNVHYNYHRPHTAVGNQPPAVKLTTGVTNVMTSNTLDRRGQSWASRRSAPSTERFCPMSSRAAAASPLTASSACSSCAVAWSTCCSASATACWPSADASCSAFSNAACASSIAWSASATATSVSALASASRFSNVA